MVGTTPSSLLLDAMAVAKQAFLDAVDGRIVQDLAFVGNASERYPWRPTAIGDLDVCVFVREMAEAAGRRLAGTASALAAALATRGVEFELRIVRGPYKRALVRTDRPVIVGHLGVFTEESFRKESPFLRYGWRKYRCVREPSRLARLSPGRPGATDLLQGPRGVEERLAALREGAVRMHEWLLPDFREVDWTVRPEDPLFVECCFAAGATCARNHGRILGHPEADSLANPAYFDWYRDSVLRSEALADLVRLKETARRVGYGGMMPTARRLALAYLAELRRDLLASLNPLTGGAIAPRMEGRRTT